MAYRSGRATLDGDLRETIAFATTSSWQADEFKTTNKKGEDMEERGLRIKSEELPPRARKLNPDESVAVSACLLSSKCPLSAHR